MNKPIKLLSLIFILCGLSSMAQTDSLIFDGGNVIIGDIKQMTRGIITIETDYSDSDFTIEWEKVVEIHTEGRYNVAFSDKTLLRSARIQTISPSQVSVTSEDGNRIAAISDIVQLRELDGDFWSKVSANVDLGFSLTKANDLRQYNARAGLGYNADKWVLNANYSQVRSDQDDAATTQRTDADISANYQLDKSFFAGVSINFLSNTEQLLDLRTSATAGLGYYLARTTNMYWSALAGLAYNGENYADSPESPGISNDRTSYEGVFTTELNMYDIGDLNVYFSGTWYPSITETGRHRVDLQFDVKYDLPLDFYIKAGTSFNYDNQPVDGASESDYVLQTGFGWEL